MRGSPIRANRLSPLLVWLCVIVNFLGWTIGAQVAALTGPAGLGGEGLKSWQGVLTANLNHVLVAATCLWVARVSFTAGWRGLGIGRQPIGSEIKYALAGWLAAIVVCGLMLLATDQVFTRLLPWFRPPDHSVFITLKDPAVTPLMRTIAIGGAFMLAPIGEELLFRGILQTAIKKVIPRRWGSMRHRWVAIGVAALLFAVMHTATPHHMVALAGLGVILGYLYERRGSLVVPILVHMLFNGKSLLWHELR